MGWIRVEDDFYDNEKMLAAGSIGRDLYWHGMGFCNRNLTDGLIPIRRALCLVDFTDSAVLDGIGGVDGQACAPIAVQRLLDAELWHEEGHSCSSCPQPGPRNYIVHDYLKYQFSKAQIQEKAEKNRQRVSAWREARKSEVREGNAECNALHTPPVQTTPTPTPTPSSSSLVTKGGAVALRNAREGASRPICSKHPNGNDNDENCRGCMKTREWDERRNAEMEADELHAKRLARESAENCPTCHGTNWIPDTEPAVKCIHKVAIHA